MAWIPPDHWKETSTQLKLSGSVTLNATGSGAVTFAPTSARQRWLVTSVVVTTNQVATATTVPVATVALNTSVPSQLSAGNQRGSSWSGNQDTWTGEMEVGPCDFCGVLFSPPPGQSGTPLNGVICTAVVTGIAYTRRA
jgi:hypothetical protein